MTNTEKTGTTSLVTETLRKEQEAEKKKTAHRFKKGQVANPNGRPKGSKNKLTLLRQAVLMNSEEIVLHNWETVVRKTLELAEEGDTTALKIIWDRMMPAKRAIDTTHDGKDKLNITINVGNLDKPADIEAEVVEDAEFSEVENDG